MDKYHIEKAPHQSPEDIVAQEMRALGLGTIDDAELKDIKDQQGGAKEVALEWRTELALLGLYNRRAKALKDWNTSRRIELEDGGRTEFVNPSKQYLVLAGEMELPTDERVVAIKFDIVITNPYEALPVFDQEKQAELDRMLLEVLPAEEMSTESALAVKFMKMKAGSIYGNKDVAVLIKDTELGLSIITKGISQLKISDETKSKMLNLARDKLLTSRPVTYSNGGIEEWFSEIGHLQTADLISSQIASVIGPSVPSNAVAAKFEQLAKSGKKFLIISGHGGTMNENYHMGENYDASERLQEIYSRMEANSEEYDFVVIVGCNVQGKDLSSQTTGVDKPVFFANGFLNNTSVLTGISSARFVDNSSGEDLLWKHDIAHTMQIQLNPETCEVTRS